MVAQFFCDHVVVTPQPRTGMWNNHENYDIYLKESPIFCQINVKNGEELKTVYKKVPKVIRTSGFTETNDLDELSDDTGN